jgi:hypothetical protein
VFKNKLKLDGTTDKYNSCLVAKGYKQKQNVDYFNTYSLVTRIASSQILFALLLFINLLYIKWILKPFFLNGELE